MSGVVLKMKASLDYSGLDRLMRNVEDMGANVQEAAVSAMQKTHEFVTEGIEDAMTSHRINGKPVNWEHTGKTKESLRTEADVQISGNLVSVKTGFEWPTAAKYLAYGRGTPRQMKASPGLKKALNSKQLKEQVLAIQEEALENYIAGKR